MSIIQNSLLWSKDQTKEDYSKEVEFLFNLDNTLQSSKSIMVQETNSQQIAFTNMHKVYLNFAQIKKTVNNNYFDFLLMTKGLNYHEMCHIMYTKYGQRDIIKAVRASDGTYDSYMAQKTMHALNILEDQRIENIFTNRYPASNGYFRLLALKIILGKGLKSDQYPLLYGRRYIIGNKEIMSEVKELFCEAQGKDVTEKFEQIIDEYVVTTDVNKQIQLALKFAKLMPQMPKNPYSNPFILKISKSNVSKEEQQLSENVKKKIESDEDIEESEEGQDGESGSGSSSESKENEKEGKGQDEESKDKKENNVPGDSEDKKTSEGNLQSQKSKIQSSDGIGKEKSTIAELLEAITEKVKEKLKSDAERQMKIMNKTSFNSSEVFINKSIKVFNPEARHVRTMKQLKEEIKKMKTDLDNRTVYNQRRGKIDMRRAMLNDNSSKVADFKRFIPSRLNKTKLAVSILLDSSGSMDDSQFETAISSGWAIANALEECGGKVKVYEFSGEYRVLKDFDDKCKESSWGRNFCGGTDPIGALKNSEESLAKVSKRDSITNQMVMLMTDGEYYTEPVETITKRLKEKGIYVVLFRVTPNDRTNVNPSKYNKIIHTTSFSELTRNMTDIVKHVQLETIRKVKASTC